jgi:hypothetical protein
MPLLVEFWVKGKKDVQLTEENRKQITVDLFKLRPYITSEFSRLPRAIEDIDYWKVIELRSFLLYYVPIILKGKLKKKTYFLILCCYLVEFKF